MFSVMHDPWIPVLWQNGKKSLVGIRDCLIHADEIKSIQDVSRLNILNYTIHSFVIDMAQDMFQPHDIDDILDLYDEGKFDAEKIDAYINMCEASGVSFDMFDMERPFMQCPKDQLEKYGVMSKDMKPVPVSTLGYEYESGNNVTFIHRKNQISYEEYAKLIQYEGANDLPLGVDLAICKKKIPLEETVSMNMTQYIVSVLYMAFANQGSGSGHRSSVATSDKEGFHPIFVLNEGRSLFETIVGSMGVASRKSYEKAVPMWRRIEYIPNIESLEDAEFLAYTYYPTHYLYPVEQEEQPRKIYNQYINFNGIAPIPGVVYENWALTYPRIIRITRINKIAKKDGKAADNEENTANPGGDEKKTIEYTAALAYKHDNYGKSELKTMLMDLAGASSSCTILSENNVELTKCGAKFKVRYFAFSHNSGRTPSNVDCQTTYAWDLGNILNKDEQIRLQKFVIWLKRETIQLGRTLTMMDAEAVGLGKDWKIHGDNVKKVNRNASQSCSRYVSQMEWKLLHLYRDRLGCLDDINLEQDIQKDIQDSACQCAKDYRIAKNDRITKAKYIYQLKYFECSMEFTDKKKNRKEKKLG